MNRRAFLQACAAGAAAAATGELAALAGETPAAPASPAPAPSPAAGVREGDMIYRTLGKTGQKVSAIGLGGFHIGKQADEADSIRLIRSAIDRGITFMDNCWDYHDGGSEVRMGKALRDGYRKKVFLMTKIDGRSKKAAAEQIDQCLQRLQTDCIDLMQHHEIIRMEDGDRIFAEGGAMEATVAAQKAGKIRFIGFTGHKDPIVHLRMLEVAADNGFRFDTLQMPLNVLDAHFRSFGAKVVPVAVKQQMGILGMKPLASGGLMKTNTVTAVEALHFALNLPTSVVITGIDSAEILDQAIEVARTFKPLTEPQVAAILAKTAQVAAKGRFEPFKTTDHYDGTARNPRWLG
jgi:predicted aldo/keto reductase-like oxidoreductase